MTRSIDNEFTPPRLAHPWGAGPVAPVARRRVAVGSVRRFSYLLLATVLSTMIVVADRIVDAWTSGGLLLALGVLWLVIFGGLVLFAPLSARLALWFAAAWRDLST